jgi:hypothetical protein
MAKEPPYDKNKEPDPRDKPVLPPSTAREEVDNRARTSGPTVARRKGEQVIKDKKKKKGRE